MPWTLHHCKSPRPHVDVPQLIHLLVATPPGPQILPAPRKQTKPLRCRPGPSPRSPIARPRVQEQCIRKDPSLDVGPGVLRIAEFVALLVAILSNKCSAPSPHRGLLHFAKEAPVGFDQLGHLCLRAGAQRSCPASAPSAQRTSGRGQGPWPGAGLFGARALLSGHRGRLLLAKGKARGGALHTRRREGA